MSHTSPVLLERGVPVVDRARVPLGAQACIAAGTMALLICGGLSYRVGTGLVAMGMPWRPVLCVISMVIGMRSRPEYRWQWRCVGCAIQIVKVYWLTEYMVSLGVPMDIALIVLISVCIVPLDADADGRIV